MLSVIRSRRSVRNYRDESVDQTDIEDLLSAAMHAPSAMNEQAWQFCVLSGSVLGEYCVINGNTPRGASIGILVCQDLTREKAKGYSIQDCSAATQNILLAAHYKGLGAVWTTVFPDNVDRVKTLLGLPEYIIPFAFIPIGYPSMNPDAQERYDAGRVHFNKW